MLPLTPAPRVPFPGSPHSSLTQLWIPPQVVRGLSAGARVFEYMALSPCIPLSGGCCIPKEHLRGSITFQNVSFRSASVTGLSGLKTGGERAGCVAKAPVDKVPQEGAGRLGTWEPAVTRVLLGFQLPLPPWL